MLILKTGLVTLCVKEFDENIRYRVPKGLERYLIFNEKGIRRK